VAYFAASTDQPEDNRRFAASLELDYPILSDPGGAAARTYGVLGEDGVHARRWTFYIGKDGTLLHVDREVAPATAGQDIAARLEALGVSR
jgi:thioredoxin-dependent peroxiredoxin